MTGLLGSLLLLLLLLFTDWRSLLEHRKFKLEFRVFK